MVEIYPEMDQIYPEKNENIFIRNPGHKSDPELIRVYYIVLLNWTLSTLAFTGLADITSSLYLQF